jgi:hypothetical protein
MANENVEKFVEQTMNQTQAAMEQYFSFVQNAFSSFPMTSPELMDKIKGFTEQNMGTVRDFVKELGQAKDFQDVVRIQTEYIQNQFHTFTEQTKSLTGSFTNAASSGKDSFGR